tara:strand:+ start:380 stop:1240 length:861 start_codon:yes stop_codon:yes gene_type:complete
MSRNEERLGGSKVSNTSPTAAVASASASSPAPLEFVRPTSLVSLPSGGRFYPEGHPLHGVSEVEVRHMTTAEEDILTSRVLLRKGTAIDKFLERLITLDVDPNDLLLGDKSALIVQARVDGYGAEYTTQVQCPACSARIKHTFDLFDHQIVEGLNVDEINGVSATDRNTFIISIDNGWEVEVRALNGHDEKRMSKAIQQRTKAGMSESSIQEQLRQMIVSISGHTDRNTINKAIQHMTGKHSRMIRDVYSKVIPNVDLKQEVTCVECLTTSEMEVPLTSDFFWPKS